MWSLGVLAYQLLGGSVPFKGKDDADTLELIKKAEISFTGDAWNKISTSGKDFIKSLICLDPA